MNVQLVPGRTHLWIVAEDLAVTVPTYDSSAWNPSLIERALNNSALNTILRTRYTPVKNVRFTCENHAESLLPIVGALVEPPQVVFGYPESTWLLDALPTAIEPKETFELPVRGDVSDMDFAFSAQLETAQLMYITALMELFDNLGDLWGLTVSHGDDGDFYRFVKTVERLLERDL